MRFRMFAVLAVLVCCVPAISQAQMPEASPEHEVLKKDVGTWKAEMKMWMAPEMPAQEMAGEEVNRMVGDLWLVSDFKADFGGMPFEGHAIMGYNPEAKKYQGSWIDSMTPAAAHMEGEFDKESNTLTTIMEQPQPDGSMRKSKSTTVYDGDDKRVFNMFNLREGT
ncbi:MAG: DUF1579 domain-containing protein [Pirellulaceae bacterium]